MQLCQILLLKLTNYESTDYKKFLIPCLTFEAAILESEKVLILKMNEDNFFKVHLSQLHFASWHLYLTNVQN